MIARLLVARRTPSHIGWMRSSTKLHANAHAHLRRLGVYFRFQWKSLEKIFRVKLRNFCSCWFVAIASKSAALISFPQKHKIADCSRTTSICDSLDPGCQICTSVASSKDELDQTRCGDVLCALLE